jgi:hypothetical protein
VFNSEPFFIAAIAPYQSSAGDAPGPEAKPKIALLFSPPVSTPASWLPAIAWGSRRHSEFFRQKKRGSAKGQRLRVQHLALSNRA